MQFLVKGDLENFQRPQIALAIYYGLVKYLVFDRITRFLTPNFTRNHVSSNLCCYLQVFPCHLKLRARFHIRFKRHGRRMDQVHHFSTKICAKNTSKTCHISCVLQESYVLIWKNHNPPDRISLSSRIFLTVEVYSSERLSRRLSKTLIWRNFKDNSEKKLSLKEIPLLCRSCLSNPSRRLSETPSFKQVERLKWAPVGSVRWVERLGGGVRRKNALDDKT